MVYAGQVIEALGDTTEARTVCRWMAADRVIPKGAPGRDGVGRADLSYRDVSMILLGMAAPVAKRAPEYAKELASLQMGAPEGAKVPRGTLLETMVHQLADPDHLLVADLWLPTYEGGWREAKATLYAGDGFVDVCFFDATGGDPNQQRVLHDDGEFALVVPAVSAPILPQWTQVTGSVLCGFGRLFVADELAEAEDNAA